MGFSPCLPLCSSWIRVTCVHGMIVREKINQRNPLFHLQLDIDCLGSNSSTATTVHVKHNYLYLVPKSLSRCPVKLPTASSPRSRDFIVLILSLTFSHTQIMTHGTVSVNLTSQLEVSFQKEPEKAQITHF